MTTKPERLLAELIIGLNSGTITEDTLVEKLGKTNATKILALAGVSTVASNATGVGLVSDVASAIRLW